MSSITKALVWTAIVAQILFALAAALAGWQTSMLAAVGEPTPRTLTAAELIAKGPGDNAHIRLTEFTFDAPLIEERDGEWRNVWILVVPKDQQAEEARTLIFLRPGAVHNQEQLDRLLEKTTLDLVVTNNLPSQSLWKVVATETVWNSYPGSETANAQFLTEPRWRVFNTTLLSANRLFDAGFANLCWGIAGGVGLVALVMMAFALLSSNGSAPAEQMGEAAAYAVGPAAFPAFPAAFPAVPAARGDTATEAALSTHSVRFGSAAVRTILPAIGGIIGILLMPAAIMQAVESLRMDRPVGGVVFGVMALVGPGLLCWVVWSLFHRVWRIEVCPSGLRWFQGGRNARHWSELAGVKRTDHVHTLQRPSGPITFTWTTLLITFRTGEVLNLSSETIANFEALFAALETYHCQQHTAARVRPSASSVLNPARATGVPWASQQ